MHLIKDYLDGETINGPLLVTGVTKGVTDNGKEYLSVTFQDCSGTIEARKWDVHNSDFDLLVPGKVVNVAGIVNSYKNNLQLKIISLDRAPNMSVSDLEQFHKVSPIPREVLIEKLNHYLNSFKDKDIALITNTVIHHFYDKYITYPAAVRIHHEFGSGILHHSLTMADLAEEVAKIYPNVNRDLLVAGALMHDVGKVIEYEKPLTPMVTVEGRLVGHISIMYAEFKKIVDPLNIKSEVPLLLEHMILSHHGKLEFGSPVLPMTLEANLLSLIDLIDSRVMIITKALETTKEGEFTPRIWALDDVSIYKPKK